MKPVYRVRIRQLHATMAPIMVLPLCLTLLTGMIFQVAELTDHAKDFRWALAVHHGVFGSLNLTRFYPFLNGFGLLTLIITGLSLWIQRSKRKSTQDA